MTETELPLPADTSGTEITRFNALKHGVLSDGGRPVAWVPSFVRSTGRSSASDSEQFRSAPRTSRSACDRLTDQDQPSGPLDWRLHCSTNERRHCKSSRSITSWHCARSSISPLQPAAAASRNLR
jgi:hypothetical protein